MTETMITVQGRYSAFSPAERATVTISAHLEGPERETVFRDTAASGERIRGLIEKRHDRTAGPVTRFSSDSVRVWSEKPWSSDGAQLPPVFHSRVVFSVTFRDFGDLSTFVEEVVAVDGASVDGISWSLTEASRAGRLAEVRSRAVKDAVAKAAVYAQSIGLGTVRAVAIADQGMLGDSRSPGDAGPELALMRAVASDSAPSLAFTPEDIELEAVVDARFEAT
jgi:hypothetical protein